MVDFDFVVVVLFYLKSGVLNSVVMKLLGRKNIVIKVSIFMLFEF